MAVTLGHAATSRAAVLQLCMAHRNDEQRKTVVLLSQRPKLDMEDTFR